MDAPRIAAARPLVVVLNAGSGKGSSADTRRVIADDCAAAGQPCEILVVEDAGQLPSLIASAIGRAKVSQAIVVAAGGDGTINAVAQATLGSGCAFGVLPQGTFNYFSRTHGIPSETPLALAVLRHASPRPVQVGLINERAFLVNASIGLYAKLLEDRESFKAQYGRHRWVAFGAGLVTVLGGHRSWHLHMDYHGTQRDIRTQTLFVANNALQMHQVGVPEAEAPHEGQLAAIAIRPVGRLRMLSLLARGALGRLGDADSVESFAFESLTVRPMRGRSTMKVKVATDGEIALMKSPLTFRVSPEPLWLVRPEVAPELDAARP